VHKTYLAIVHGAPRVPEGTVDAPITRARGGRYRVTTPGDREGLAARTRYRLRLCTPDRRFSLLEVVPETGRSHQIRLHLASIGLPVAGDRLYGQSASGLPRLCLHAYRLTLPHPRSGEPITITAPPPALFDWDEVGGYLALDRSGEIAAGTAMPARPRSERAGLLELLRLAVDRRAPLAADPDTTIYRLVNGAADGLPGVTLDRYGDVGCWACTKRARPGRLMERRSHPAWSKWQPMRPDSARFM